MSVRTHLRPFSFAATASIWIVACGSSPTLTRTTAGWHDAKAPYYITPGPQGELLNEAWTLANHERQGDGYRLVSSPSGARDLEFTRAEDDGILVVMIERIAPIEVGKAPGVLADHWLDHVVKSPQRDDDPMYEALVPPLHMSAEVHSMTRQVGSIEATSGRDVQETRREDFAVPEGSATELEANLIPGGAPGPDRLLYLAVLKPAQGTNMVVVAYANTPSRFAHGLPDAVALAHRIRFPR